MDKVWNEENFWRKKAQKQRSPRISGGLYNPLPRADS